MRALLRVALVAVALSPSVASAQAWTRDQGTGYVNVSVSTLSGDEIFGTDGVQRPIGNDYSQTIVSLYSELGVIDRWLTITINSELYRRNVLEDLAATEGFGDLRVGAWSGLLDGPLRLTLGVELGLPTGDDEPSAGEGADSDAEQAANSLPTGDGELDIAPTVIVGGAFGGGWYPLRHFATASVGYWLRTRGFADAIRYQLELGTQVPAKVFDRFWFIARLRGVESFVGESASSFAGLGDGVTYTTVSFELSGRIYDTFGAAVAYDTAFRARGIIAAAPLQFKLSYEF